MARNSLRRPFISKKFQKRIAGRCRICRKDLYELLDVHRIDAGGKYSVDNTSVLCCECHRKQQAGLIKIVRWVNSTAGRMLYWIDEQGQEQFS